MLLSELMSFSLCRNGRKNPQPSRWEQRAQTDFLAKAQRTAKANASGREGKRVCQWPAGSAPLIHHPPLVPASLQSEAEMVLGTCRQLIQDNIFCSLPNNTTGQQYILNLFTWFYVRERKGIIEITLPVVCTVCECFTSLRRDQKDIRRALRTTIFILKHINLRP